MPKVFSNAAYIIAVGNGLVHEISNYTSKPIEILFNIVTPMFNNLDKTQNKNEIFTFFSLGVNAKKKGFDILLSAFSNFILQGNKGKLIIAGLEDREQEWLLSLHFKPEVLSQVIFLGKLDRQSVVTHMQMCDCFVLVSRHETFGIVFAEAMYCGKPVIASMTGGPDSFVTKETGILVPIEDIEKTTEAMIKMVENHSKYDESNIKLFAENNFAADTICEKLLKIYQKILDTNSFKYDCIPWGGV